MVLLNYDDRDAIPNGQIHLDDGFKDISKARSEDSGNHGRDVVVWLCSDNGR
jgi:hypothetical protein